MAMEHGMPSGTAERAAFIVVPVLMTLSTRIGLRPLGSPDLRRKFIDGKQERGVPAFFRR